MTPPKHIGHHVPRSSTELVRLYDQAAHGVGAETLFKVLQPILEAKFVQLMAELRDAAPELGSLLDARAKLCEIWRQYTELERAYKTGLSVRDTLVGIYEGVKEVKQEEAS